MPVPQSLLERALRATRPVLVATVDQGWPLESPAALELVDEALLRFERAQLGRLDRPTSPFKPFRNPLVMRAAKTCDACPEQYEGWLEGGLAFYLRLRSGWASLGVGSTLELAVDDSMIDNVSVQLEVDTRPSCSRSSLMGAFETEDQRDEVFDVLLAERLRRLRPLILINPTDDQRQRGAQRAHLARLIRCVEIVRSRSGTMPPLGELERAEHLVSQALSIALVELPTFAGDIVVHALTAARGIIEDEAGGLPDTSLEHETVELIDQALAQVERRPDRMHRGGHLTLAGEIAAMSHETRDALTPLEERLGCRVREAIDAGLILRMLAARSRVRTRDAATLDGLVSLADATGETHKLWDWTWPPKLDDHARILIGIAIDLAIQGARRDDVARELDPTAEDTAGKMDGLQTQAEFDRAELARGLGISRRALDVLMTDSAGVFQAGAVKRQTLGLLLQTLEAATGAVVEDVVAFFDGDPADGKIDAQVGHGSLREDAPALLARAKGVQTLATDVRVAAEDLSRFTQLAEHVAGNPDRLRRLVDVAERTAVHFIDTDAPLGRDAFAAFRDVGAKNPVLEQSYAKTEGLK